MLIVLGGLPGTGKSTLAHAFARERGAAWLRIDTIEQALRASGRLAGDVGPAGYVVAYAQAEELLRLGGGVVADCVNPLAITRAAWRRAAAAVPVAIVEIEVVCSDPAEHRRRVETRAVDVAGLAPPTWAQVQAHDYEPWTTPRHVLDTAGRDPAASLAALRRIVDAAPPLSA